MSNKHIIITIVVAVVVGAAGFFGGMKYGQTAKALAGLSQAQRQQLFAGLRGSGAGGGPGAGGGTGFGGRRGGAGGAGNAFASGSVLSKDDKSITVKMQDGSSKIVFYSGTTTIGKSISGTSGDLAAGQQVTVNGNSNSDGSLNAMNIQIRPAMPGAPQ